MTVTFEPRTPSDRQLLKAFDNASWAPERIGRRSLSGLARLLLLVAVIAALVAMPLGLLRLTSSLEQRGGDRIDEASAQGPGPGSPPADPGPGGVAAAPQALSDPSADATRPTGTAAGTAPAGVVPPGAGASVAPAGTAAAPGAGGRYLPGREAPAGTGRPASKQVGGQRTVPRQARTPAPTGRAATSAGEAAVAGIAAPAGQPVVPAVAAGAAAVTVTTTKAPATATETRRNGAVMSTTSTFAPTTTSTMRVQADSASRSSSAPAQQEPPVGWLKPSTLSAAGLGTTVTIKSRMLGTYLQPSPSASTDSEVGIIRASAAGLGPNERFTLVSQGSDVWAIRADGTGRYWCAQTGWSGSAYATVQANSSGSGSCTQFRIYRFRDGVFGLNSASNGQFLKIEPDYPGNTKNVIRAVGGGSATAWSQFYLA